MLTSTYNSASKGLVVSAETIEMSYSITRAGGKARTIAWGRSSWQVVSGGEGLIGRSGSKTALRETFGLLEDDSSSRWQEQAGLSSWRVVNAKAMIGPALLYCILRSQLRCCSVPFDLLHPRHLSVTNRNGAGNPR